jgi:hypothetical protein
MTDRCRALCQGCGARSQCCTQDISKLRSVRTLISIVDGSSVRMAVSPASISTPLSLTGPHCDLGSSPTISTFAIIIMRAFAMLNTSGALAMALPQWTMIKATRSQTRHSNSTIRSSCGFLQVYQKSLWETDRVQRSQESSWGSAHLLSM